MNTNDNSIGSNKSGYNLLLLIVAGMGGLLYGIDVGIISGALPYLQATFTLPDGSQLTSQQISQVVSAVLLGTVISTLFAGMLSDWFGRRTIMSLSGILFVASIPMIALAHTYGLLVFGRILQGISGGLIGVSAPLYLAECLGASSRGKGTGIFQWMLVLGILSASLVGLYFSHRVDEVASLGNAATCLAEYFLGVAAPGDSFCYRDFYGVGIAAMAVPPWQHFGNPCGLITFTQ